MAVLFDIKITLRLVKDEMNSEEKNRSIKLHQISFEKKKEKQKTIF